MSGDVKATSRTSVPGMDYTAHNTLQVVDYTTFSGSVGLGMSNNDDVSVGLNYDVQLCEHRTGHGINAVLRYEF